MSERREARLKRMRMRAWRRGTKEMDLILGPYADAHLENMDPQVLDLFDRILEENDQDLYPWVTGATVPPDDLSGLLAEIAVFAFARLSAQS